MEKEGGRNINNMLPFEILEKIFCNCSFQMLKVVVLVCRRWREAGEGPRLWSRLRVVVHAGNKNLIPEVLAIRRLQGLRQIEMMAVSKKLLGAVADHRGLKELKIGGPALASFQHELLTNALCNLERAQLVSCFLTPAQINSIFKTLLSGCSLVSLQLSGNNRSLAEANLLGRGVAKLVDVNLSRTFLTTDQLNAIALEVTRARYTRCLDLSYNDLSTLLPNLLADLVASLSTVSLEESHLVEAQVNALFTTPVKENGEVPPPKKTIGLSFNNLSSVEPLALARFILEWVFFLSDAYSFGRNFKQPRSIFLLKACDCRFKEALLAGCNLTQAQTEAVFVALVETPDLRFRIIYKFDSMNSS